MALDREISLKKAEKLLRQGRLDAAIGEYERVVEDQPRDWNTANVLGDLYARAGRTDEALAQYARIAEHSMRDGFYPKAAALYKKILKIDRDDEAAQLQLAELSALQGLIADAKSRLNAIAARRRTRSDRRGEAEIVVRLGTLDPSDIEARLTAARTLESMGRTDEAADLYRSIHADLEEKGRMHEALDALREFVRLHPGDAGARGLLARAALQAGDDDRARHFLDRETAGTDPQLLVALAGVHLRAGDADAVRELIPDILTANYPLRHELVESARAVAPDHPAAAFACIDAVVDAALGASDFREAATTLQDFVRRVPAHIGSLLKLVEVCVDGGFESDMYAAQAQLTDAYLAAGQAAEARVIAEDLVAQEPWEPSHIERFRRALVLLRVSDPDAEIADRLSGQIPFVATDPFMAPPESPVQPSIDAGAEETHAPAHSASAEPPTSSGSIVPGAPPTVVSAEEIDLTGALGSLDKGPVGNGPPASRHAGDDRHLETAFEELRAGAETSADYSAQHMTLARTYLEMGMADEAIGSLSVAARSPRLRFEAGSTLGRLLLKRGEIPQALEWLERAAEAPAPSADEGWALMYDFGVALDEAGETARALAVLLELQADAGDYRDVPSRIDRLARAQTGG